MFKELDPSNDLTFLRIRTKVSSKINWLKETKIWLFDCRTKIEIMNNLLLSRIIGYLYEKLSVV